MKFESPAANPNTEPTETQARARDSKAEGLQTRALEEQT